MIETIARARAYGATLDFVSPATTRMPPDAARCPRPASTIAAKSNNMNNPSAYAIKNTGDAGMDAQRSAPITAREFPAVARRAAHRRTAAPTDARRLIKIIVGEMASRPKGLASTRTSSGKPGGHAHVDG
jgi:hypothetical protein